jgi:hypothetical protein
MTDQSDDRTSVELRLSEALVREATELLGDVSVVVESALRRRIEHEKLTRELNFQERLDATIDLAAQFHQRHGVWGEEFSTL